MFQSISLLLRTSGGPRGTVACERQWHITWMIIPTTRQGLLTLHCFWSESSEGHWLHLQTENGLNTSGQCWAYRLQTTFTWQPLLSDMFRMGSLSESTRSAACPLKGRQGRTCSWVFMPNLLPDTSFSFFLWFWADSRPWKPFVSQLWVHFIALLKVVSGENLI